MNIVIIVGSTRPGRKSIFVAEYIKKVGKDYSGDKFTLVDPIDFPDLLMGRGNDYSNPKYSKIVEEADAFIIVSPEYNHSFPGALKSILDSELENYIHKPVALVGVSSGRWGGTRVVESLLPVVRELGMVITFADLQFPNVSKIFDENGEIIDTAYEDRVKKSFDELLWMAKTMKHGRDNITK